MPIPGTRGMTLPSGQGAMPQQSAHRLIQRPRIPLEVDDLLDHCQRSRVQRVLLSLPGVYPYFRLKGWTRSSRRGSIVECDGPSPSNEPPGAAEHRASKADCGSSPTTEPSARNPPTTGPREKPSAKVNGPNTNPIHAPANRTPQEENGRQAIGLAPSDPPGSPDTGPRPSA